jgi:hypothetical protein
VGAGSFSGSRFPVAALPFYRSPRLTIYVSLQSSTFGTIADTAGVWLREGATSRRKAVGSVHHTNGSRTRVARGSSIVHDSPW